MNKISLVLIGCVAPITFVFGQKPLVVNPKIKEVTVYLSGAEIRYHENVPLKAGLNTVHFKGLSPSLLDNSVQVTVGNGVDIVSVSVSSEKLSAAKINPALIHLKDSVGLLENQITLLANQIDAFNVEKATLAQNQKIGGPQGSVSLVELAKAADFFRERTLKINNSLFELNNALKVQTDLLTSTKEKLEKETKNLNLTRYSIVATVNSKSDHNEEFFIRHLVEDAYWEANYDIVASEISKPIVLKYKARIYNDTEIAWQNVKVLLSTGDISMNATRPYLTTWNLNYTTGGNEGWTNSKALGYFSGADTVTSEKDITVSELNKIFTVDMVQSIPADGEPFHISLQSETMQASFEYLTIPKMESSVFLLAKVTGWERLNLIDGAANIYYGNSFIGESAINTQQIGDTLELSLGRDNQIIVDRSKVEDKGNTPSIGGKRSESFIYEIQVKNNRKIPVSIRVLDQIPVSQEKDITVEASDISGAGLDALSGRLLWLKNLNAGETVKYRIAFSVKYPKNKKVAIRKNRTVRTPRFRSAQNKKTQSLLG
jgi:uncharacterized protein (TIGR02231 family)